MRISICFPELAIVLVSVVLVMPAPASAVEARRVAVVPIIVGRSEDLTLSKIYDVVRSVARTRDDLELLTDAELDALLSSERTQRPETCGPDRPCIVEHLRRVGVQSGLIIVVNMTLQPPLVSVELLDIDVETSPAPRVSRP